jgi:hypothetical protein
LKVGPCQLVEEGLEDVAGADAGVGGDREAVLGRDGETEAVGALARAADLELGRLLGQGAVDEDRQGAQALHLPVQRHAGHRVVGRPPGDRRARPAFRRRPAPPPHDWHLGHQ